MVLERKATYRWATVVLPFIAIAVLLFDVQLSV